MRPGLLRLPSLLALAVSVGMPVGAQVVSEEVITEGQGGFEGNLAQGCRFGFSATSLGDVDGDGTTDVAVGAPLDDDGGTAKGSVYVLFLEPDGTVKDEQRISLTAGGFQGPLVGSAYFGSDVAGLGDIDGDSVPDLAVGSDGDGTNGFRRGAVWILFLNPDGTVKGQQRICETTGGFGGTLDDQDRFGSALARIDDLDGNGLPELAVGARLDDDGQTDAGAVWILFLNADGTVSGEQKISFGNGGLSATFREGDEFGSALASLGDLDGDGNDELAVGTPHDRDAPTGTKRDNGAVYVLFLSDTGTVSTNVKISDVPELTFPLPPPPFNLDRDLFGSAVLGIGDQDGDGVNDMAVGAVSTSIEQGVHLGGVWIVLLESDGNLKSKYLILPGLGGMQGPLVGGDQFGAALARIDDGDGNGLDDLLVGAWGMDSSGFDAGGLWVLSIDSPAAPQAELRNDAQGLNEDILEVLPIPGQNSSYLPEENPGPFIGATFLVRLDMVGLDQPMGTLFGFDTPVEIPVSVGTGGVLLCLDTSGAGELLSGAGLTASVVGGANNRRINFTFDLPNDSSISGLGFSLQAFIFGGGEPVSFTNAADLVIGVLF